MNRLTVNLSKPMGTIHRNLYGHFSEHLGRCIYGGIYVGPDSPIPNQNGMRTDVVQALKHIAIPVLRWPGGCFADEYHWMDGIGPKNARKRMVNTHWGGVVEDNSFGTHEYMELCRQLGCEPYINANLGSGTVQEMSQWVEYLTFDGVSPMADKRAQNGRMEPWRVKYWGVGNENWGCGGNMRPEFYADQYRRYQTYCRNYGENRLYKIACGANSFDYDWTDKVLQIAGRYMDAITLHYYTVPGSWQHKGSATAFTREEYYRTLEKALQMEPLLDNHIRIMDMRDPQGRIGLIVDEWGAWYDVEPDTNPGFLYQQNTMRDALVAAATLNIFNQHCRRVVMANLAQTVNVLQSVILTEGDQMVLTPTYHVFDLYRAHQDAALLESHVQAPMVGQDGAQVPALHVSASQKTGGRVHLTLANLSDQQSYAIHCNLTGQAVSGRLLHGAPQAHNTFDAPDTVRPQPLDGVCMDGHGLRFEIPPCAVAAIEIEAAHEAL